MGQQQLLLIILGVIIVGIAIAVGLSMFSAQSIGASKDAMVTDLLNLSANAYQFYVRPVAMGGGGNSFVGYGIPTKLATNENGTYAISGTPTTSEIAFKASGLAANSTNTVEFKIGADGRVVTGSYTYGGAFAAAP
jgi:hypothetical protein